MPVDVGVPQFVVKNEMIRQYIFHKCFEAPSFIFKSKYFFRRMSKNEQS